VTQLAPPNHFPLLQPKPMVPISSILARMHILPVLAIDFPMARELLCFRSDGR